jgi:hypothetical protein
MVNSIEEVETLSAKIDSMMSMMSKPNLDNVALQEIVVSSVEGVDVNYIKNQQQCLWE